MPLPRPRDGESKEEFIDRCMGDAVMGEDFDDPGQRRAVCERQWDAGRSQPAAEWEIRLAPVNDLRVESRGVAQVIRGYAIVFNEPSEDLGMFREVIAPEAVDRTLEEQIDLRALVEHDPARILGRLSAGTLRVEKDRRGFHVEIDPPATTAGADIVQAIRRRDVTGMSFAFRTLKDDWDFQQEPPLRTLRDMRMREVSIVTFPAYPETAVALRSLSAFRVAQRAAARGRPVTVAERLRWSSKTLDK